VIATARLASLTLLAAIGVVAASVPSAAQGRISNAAIETRALAGTLEREVQAIAARAGATWIGYRAPMIPGAREMCCHDSIARASDCDNVPPAASLAWLTTLARSTGDSERENRVVQPAIAALALHPGEGALRTLIALARDDQRPKARSQALFWLAQRAGQEALATISNAVQNDPETEVKKRAVFALSQLPKDEGIPLLIQVARTNKNAEVRKQAMFWLGQSRDPRAADFFEQILK
jgi:hypothetical protein